MATTRPKIVSKNLFLSKTVILSIVSYFLLEVQPTLTSYFDTGNWTPYSTRSILKAAVFSAITVVMRYSTEQLTHTPVGLPGRNPVVVHPNLPDSQASEQQVGVDS